MRGRRELPLQDRLIILEQALAAGACAFDLELESASQARAWFMAERPGVCRILSWHNDQDSTGLDDAIAAFRTLPADIYKVVCTARKLTDNLIVLHRDFSELEAPVIRFAMHPTGQISRILGLATGSPFIYAAPSSANRTAPGQLTIDQLRTSYAVDRPWGIQRVFAVLASSSEVAVKCCRSYNESPHCLPDAVYVPCVLSDPVDFLDFAARLPLSGFSVHHELQGRFPRWKMRYDQATRRASRLGMLIGPHPRLGAFTLAHTEPNSLAEQGEKSFGTVPVPPQQSIFYVLAMGTVEDRRQAFSS